MSDQSPSKRESEQTTAVQVIYILYLASIAAGFTSIIGVIWAYVARGSASEDDWQHSHFTFQIRTFWMSLLFTVISFLLMIILIGFVMLLAVLGWYVVRCIKGLIAHGNQEPMPNPHTWLW